MLNEKQRFYCALQSRARRSADTHRAVVPSSGGCRSDARNNVTTNWPQLKTVLLELMSFSCSHLHQTLHCLRTYRVVFIPCDVFKLFKRGEVNIKVVIVIRLTSGICELCHDEKQTSWRDWAKRNERQQTVQRRGDETGHDPVTFAPHLQYNHRILEYKISVKKYIF